MIFVGWALVFLFFVDEKTKGGCNLFRAMETASGRVSI